MKFVKNVIVIITFFIPIIINAKQTGVKTIPVQTTLPLPKTKIAVQPVKQPTLQPQSYANALNVIRNQMRPQEVLHNNQFTSYFINFVKDSIKNDGNNAALFAKALLQAGAYLYAPFMNEDVINSTIINDLNNEINRHMKAFFVQNKPEIISEPIIRKIESIQQPVQERMHLVTTDLTTLRKLDLYPLFGEDGGLYFVFNPQARLFSGEIVARFEGEDVPQNAPSIVQLGKFNGWNRMLMQLKSLNQFELADVTGLDPALCAGHSLNNGQLIRQYALTGNVQYLKDLHNIQKSANFLLDLKIGAWLNVEVLRAQIAKMKGLVDGVDISVISTVSLFDSHLDKKTEFAVFDAQEFAYAQKVKQNIQAGLQKNNYVHIMVIGNEEMTEALGHYFCFAIIKRGNEIQYIVLDTIPRAYHLQPGSHERDRLMFVIQNIEKGASDIKVTNLRIRFIQE